LIAALDPDLDLILLDGGLPRIDGLQIIEPTSVLPN